MVKNFISHQEKLSIHIFKINFYQINKAYFKIGKKKQRRKKNLLRK